MTDLRPRPMQPKPIAEMTLAEFSAWSRDLANWANEKDLLAASLVPVVSVDPHRVDHKGQIYPPAAPSRKRGSRPPRPCQTREYNRQKARESRERRRKEEESRRELIREGLQERKRKGAA